MKLSTFFTTISLFESFFHCFAIFCTSIFQDDDNGIPLTDLGSCDGDLCYSAFSFDRRKQYQMCINGMKYLEPGCYYDYGNGLLKDQMYFCACDLCNEPLPPGDSFTTPRPLTPLKKLNTTFDYKIISFAGQMVPLKYQQHQNITQIINSTQTQNTKGTFCQIWGKAEINKSDNTLDSVEWNGDAARIIQDFYGIDNFVQKGLLPIYNGAFYGYQFNDQIHFSMSCDWDLCNNRSIDFLREKQVTCYYSENSSELITDQQCIGQACLQVWNQSSGSLFRRGCFFQDWRFAEGRIETGIYSLPNWITISICAEDYCNKDTGTVNKSLLDCSPKYPRFTPYKYSLLNRNLSSNGTLIVNEFPEDYTLTCAMEKPAYSLILLFFLFIKGF